MHAIYDFVLSGWLTITSETAKVFLNGILETHKHRQHGVHSLPDPVKTKLECAYILYITDIITDISSLKELADGSPHLQFLIDPESFDHTQVDFSDYMWNNFAMHKKYMEHFVAHKDDIIPRIKKRVEKGDVSETEKKFCIA